MFGDMRGEEEKLTEALDIALNVISKEKQDGKDEEGTIADTQNKEVRKKGYLGTHAMIKLPYVIGTKEYDKHLYAGMVYLGNLGEDLE